MKLNEILAWYLLRCLFAVMDAYYWIKKNYVNILLIVGFFVGVPLIFFALGVGWKFIVSYLTFSFIILVLLAYSNHSELIDKMNDSERSKEI